MDSNADRAEHGDLIEITNPARVDFGKRMQIVTVGDIAVTALDNRARVKIEHGDYKVARRCGRPATADAVGAGPAKRAAAKVEPPPADEIPAPKVVPRVSDVTSEEVARLEAAVYEVPVTRKTQVNTNTPEPAGAEDRANKAEAEKAAPGTSKTAPQAKSELEDALRWHNERLAAEACGKNPHMIDAARYSIGAAHLLGVDFARGPDRTAVTITRKHSHYFKDVSAFDSIDVYRVLERFNVTDPCLQHAVKKLLVAGARGAKDIGKDVQEAIDTLQRWQEMRAEEAA